MPFSFVFCITSVSLRDEIQGYVDVCDSIAVNCIRVRISSRDFTEILLVSGAELQILSGIVEGINIPFRGSDLIISRKSRGVLGMSSTEVADGTVQVQD